MTLQATRNCNDHTIYNYGIVILTIFLIDKNRNRRLYY